MTIQCSMRYFANTKNKLINYKDSKKNIIIILYISAFTQVTTFKGLWTGVQLDLVPFWVQIFDR